MNDFTPKEDSSVWERWAPGALGETRARPAGARGAKSARSDPAADENARNLAAALDAARATGLKEGRAQAQKEAQRLARAAAQAETLIGEAGAQLAAEVLDLALELARQMMRTELKVRRESLLAVVREALDCLPHGTTGAQLALNPADVELVRAHVGDEIKAGALRLLEDHRIEPGGCRIIAPACEVDATLATRWKRLVATLGVDHNWLDLT